MEISARNRRAREMYFVAGCFLRAVTALRRRRSPLACRLDDEGYWLVEICRGDEMGLGWVWGWGFCSGAYSCTPPLAQNKDRKPVPTCCINLTQCTVAEGY